MCTNQIQGIIMNPSWFSIDEKIPDMVLEIKLETPPALAATPPCWLKI